MKKRFFLFATIFALFLGAFLLIVSNRDSDDSGNSLIQNFLSESNNDNELDDIDLDIDQEVDNEISQLVEEDSLPSSSVGKNKMMSYNHAIDLGLPSGTKWADMNVGAKSPEEYGDYFSWGETIGYKSGGRECDWANYQWCNSSWKEITKYCNNSAWGTVDNILTLELEDDAAHVNWGGSWHIPTKSDYDELYDNCKWTWTTLYGVNGYKVIGPNDNFIFIPAAGSRCNGTFDEVNEHGYYWLSSLSLTDPRSADVMYFIRDEITSWGNARRADGNSIRAVCIE